MSDLSHYPKTDLFEIIDTIGTPHPFCVTHHHVAYAADNCGGRLGNDVLERFEKSKGGSGCGMKGCQLTYAEHETALLVKVHVDKDLQDIPELQAYLLECKPICEADGFAGFAFIK